MIKYCFVLFFCSLVLGDNDLFDRCKSTDKKCLLEETRKVHSKIVDGYKKFKIPSFKPFKVPSVELQGSGLYLKWAPVDFIGLELLEFKDVSFDVTRKTINMESYLADGNVTGPYHFKGKIGPLTIDGEGDSITTTQNVTFYSTVKYDLIDKDGKKYADIVSSDLDYKVDRIIFNFKDIIKGNPEISKATNDVINENWFLVNDSLKSGMKEVLNIAFTVAFKQIFQNVPFDELIES